MTFVETSNIAKAEPTSRNNKVLRWAEYFMRANYMFEVVEDLKEHLDDGAIDKNGLSVYFISHLELWLACLYVVVEGYEELRLADPMVDELIPKNRDVLRRLRNYALHYTPDIRRFHDFMDSTVDGQLSLNWARDLHFALRDFILRYCNEAAFREHVEKRRNYSFNLQRTSPRRN